MIIIIVKLPVPVKVKRRELTSDVTLAQQDDKVNTEGMRGEGEG